MAIYNADLDKVASYKCLPLEKIYQIRKGTVDFLGDGNALYGVAIYY